VNAITKIILILGLLALFISKIGFAQEGSSSVDDDEFKLFLFTLAFVFIAGVIGAAIVGGMAAALVLFFIFSLISLGAISTSVGVGLYKRSYEAGFKTFLIIVFSISCGIIGGIGLFLLNFMIHMPIANVIVVLIGIAGGILGGYILAVSTFRLFQAFVKLLSRRLKSIA
jgi:hypothetical protein